MGERRTAARQKSFLSGKIYFNRRLASMDCLVRDISATGARLIFSPGVTIPDNIELYIPQKNEMLRAEVHWRQGDEVGVAFPMATDAATSEAGDLATRVEKLETEIVALKRMLRRLNNPDSDLA